MPIQVHVISIENVAHRFIFNTVNVLNKVIQFCADKPNYNVVHVSTLEQLDELVRNPPEELVLVNGHGETIPIPETWNSWQPYLTEISNNINEHGWVVVSICGMPFWCCASDANETDIELSGINSLIAPTGSQLVNPWVFAYCNLTQFGKNAAKFYGEKVTNVLYCARALRFPNLSFNRSMYRLNEFSGVSAIKVGTGFLVHNGVLPSNISIDGGEISRITDEYVTLLSMVLTLSVLDSITGAENIFERCRNNEDDLRTKIIIPLLRLKGFNNVSDVHGSDEHGRDVVCFLNDHFGNRVNFGFQIKADDIHNSTGRPLSHNIRTIINQINEAFEVSYDDPFSGETKKIHVMYVITSNRITPQAKRTIVDRTAENKRYVHFIDGGQLKEEWLRNYIF